MLFKIEIREHGLLSAPRAFDEFGQRTIAVWADHKAHVSGVLEQARPEALRHASGHADHRVLLHEPLELTQPADHALLGMVTNGTRVQENDVSAFGSVH